MSGETQPPEQQIDDPEELSQKQRIREILDRRKQTLEARDEAKMSTLMGDVSEEDALLYYRSRLKNLIYELWNVVRNMEDGEGEEYLESQTIGHVVIYPPDDFLETIGTWDSGVSPPEPEKHAIEGLQWYINNPDTIEATFKIQSFDPPQSEEIAVERVLNWHELDMGLRTCLELMDDAGIDAKLIDTETEAFSKYEWIADKIEDDDE